MRILESGNPDLQTQALAVLGTSAVNALEVRRGMKDCGAIPLLVSLLGSKNAAVQEWAAYALRKAASKASDPALGKAIIEVADDAGATRMLVRMVDLRSREAVEEAQQTLEYFGVQVGRYL
jgi:HEAT repeat protein